MIDPVAFGRNIRALRESRGLTEYELSIQVDIDYPQLGKAELGKQLPTVKKAVGIANYFSVTLDSLFLGEENAESPDIINIKSLLSEIEDDAELEHLYRVLMVLCGL